MRHYRHEFEHLDETSGSTIRVIIYVDTQAPYTIEDDVLDIAAERAVELIVDQAIWDETYGD